MSDGSPGSTIGLDKIYRLSDRVASRKIVDEVILVPLRDSVAEMESLYSLNEVGARVYDLIDGRRTVRGIIAAIVEEFDVGDEQAKGDVVQFLASMTAFVFLGHGHGGGVSHSPAGEQPLPACLQTAPPTRHLPLSAP